VCSSDLKKARQLYEQLVKSYSNTISTPAHPSATVSVTTTTPIASTSSSTVTAAATLSPPNSSSSSAANTNPFSYVTNTLDLRAALWALGHIGSTELGLTSILNADSMFLEWCIENVCSCAHFSIRGTFFHVLGLLSRSIQGSRMLKILKWDCSVLGGNSAVAIPQNPSELFNRRFHNFTATSLSNATNPSLSTASTVVTANDTSANVLMRRTTLTRSLSISLRDHNNPMTSNIIHALPYLQNSTAPLTLKLLVPSLLPGNVDFDLEVLNLVSKVQINTFKLKYSYSHCNILLFSRCLVIY
jgi:hypothetical protein